MPKNETIKKILLIGSGPITIGQAAEFDFSGSQACKALKEENIKVVLINPNPATIMTDPDMTYSVYLEPLNLKIIEHIINFEKPDSIIASIGGQTGLNVTSELDESGILKKYNLKIIGTSLNAIKNTENRNLFKKLMLEIGEKVPASCAITSLNDIDKVIAKHMFPLIVRPAYTLGGSGSGIANTKEELIDIASYGLKVSRIHQVLIEESVCGWSEIEYEVIRDKNNTCAILCTMENIDPIGIHTGDSIVVAPIQTIPKIYQKKLQESSIKIIKALKIEGGCNIQFAYKDGDYKIIEVNPRVSRSSALASKATGFPIARFTAKLSIGYTLDELLKNIEIGSSNYQIKINNIVVKIPRWPFEKFNEINKTLTTFMKSTGEVMAIGSTIEEAIMKAIRSLDIDLDNIFLNIKKYTEKDIIEKLTIPTDERLFIIFEALKRNYNINLISELTNINPFFIQKLKNIIDTKNQLKNYTVKTISKELLLKVKKIGFSDLLIGKILNSDENSIYNIRKKYSIIPSYRIVDSCSSDLISYTPYYYSTYTGQCLNFPSKNKKILILGSGPIRIGQGIEFDYCTVHAAITLKEEQIETLIINNNPETVSTDFDISNKLFFEPLTLEDIMNVIEKENPYGVCVQFGGQTAINLALELQNEIKNRKLNTLILGTTPENIDISENREKFNYLMKKLCIKQPIGATATSIQDALKISKNLCGYPIIIRPSYVLGGKSMIILFKESDLINYLNKIIEISTKKPLLINEYLNDAIEIDVDAICDGETVFIGAIMEHIEEAGIHSGDSSCIIPTQTLSYNVLNTIKKYTQKIALALNIIGLINIQMAVFKEEVFVLEANPRSSRTIPFVSKAIGIPLAKIAVKIIACYKLKNLNLEYEKYQNIRHIAIKKVVFPFDKLIDSNTLLGPEMKSTGEVIGIDYDFGLALYKSELAAGNKLFINGSIVIYIEDLNHKFVILKTIKFLKNYFNFKIFLCDDNINSTNLYKPNEILYSKVNFINLIDKINNNEINLVFNLISLDQTLNLNGEKLRRACIFSNITYVSTIRSMNLIIKALVS